MTVRVFRYSDSSAPVFSGAPGDLVALLTACLVDGYGAKTAAGWTKPYTGTNKAAFQQGSGSNGFLLRVDDTEASGNYNGRVRGFESMSDVDTGTQPFPTTGQIADPGLYVPKKIFGDTTNPRTWYLVADEGRFYCYLEPYTNANYHFFWAFGDLLPTKDDDEFHTFLIANNNDSPSSAPVFTNQQTITTDVVGKYVARKFDQLGNAIQIGTHTDSVKGGASTYGNGSLPYPHGPDGGLYLAPIWAHEYQSSTPAVRGVLPGCWAPMHNQPFNTGDTFNGTGDMVGKTFLGLKIQAGSIALEISDTWDLG